jgi:NDP-sugar pyrophosphorylase family protein
MNQKPTLLVLAAGMASRYGRLKQLESFGPSGETIIDYSIYDAVRAGFGKAVFVVRKSTEKEFHEILLRKFSEKIIVDTVTQELDMLPEGFSLPENRVKPWGTGHAVMVASSNIKEPFAVINADDFYGYQSFKSMANFLQTNKDEHLFALMGYQLKKTLSKSGTVSRGICDVNKDNYLENVTEHTKIIETEQGIISYITDQQTLPMTGNEIVSMNMMGFNPSVFPYFQSYFKEFLDKEGHDIKAEFYLPVVVTNLIKSGIARVKVLYTQEKWFGVTYPDDRPLALQSLKELTKAGVYPANLWNVPAN